MPAFKKERIKDQMVRTAARLWQVPENEIDTGFDPLILLMMEACAAELEKIGYDISASHSRPPFAALTRNSLPGNVNPTILSVSRIPTPCSTCFSCPAALPPPCPP